MAMTATAPRPVGRSTRALIEDEVIRYLNDPSAADRTSDVAGYALARRVEDVLETARRLVPTEEVSYPGIGHTHSEWQALPTKEHLAEDDLDAPGTGPDGWGIYLDGMEDEGYFAWLHHKAEAELIVNEHNAAVRAALGEEG